VIFHPEVEDEAESIRDWYASQGVPQKSDELEALLGEKIAEVANAPLSFPRDPRRSWARRVRLLNWPYTLIYMVTTNGDVLVLAIEHGKRRPGYWRARRRR
jgi:plasmid stabilization system protein ParE